MRHWFTLRALLLAAPALAQPMPLPSPGCTMGQASADLVGRDVRARVYNTGSLFFGGRDEAQYVVPASDGVSPIYAQGFLLAGKVAGEVRAAGATYDRFAFRPGLIGTDRTAPDQDECDAADRIWRVARTDVERYEQTGVATTDLAEWPSHLGAPTREADGDPSTFNLSAGDRPLLSGDATWFWAMTDGAARERHFGGLPLGVDVTVEAFTFQLVTPALASALYPATVFRYRVTNRSGAVIDSLHAGMFIDYDLGAEYVDDYAGTDTTTAMVYAYNADNEDVGGWGEAPPAVGVAIVESPAGIGLTSSHYLTSGASTPQNDPVSAEDLFHRLRGDWNDGSPMRECGDGYQCTGPVTPFAFPGDPVTGAFWSERNNGTGSNTPGDRRALMGSGPVRLVPNASATWTFAILYGRGADHLDSVTRLRTHAAQAHTAQRLGVFAARTTTPTSPPASSPPDPPPFAIAPPAPNPFDGSTTIRLQSLPATLRLTLTVRDVLGRVVERHAVPTGATSLTVGDGLAVGVYTVDLSAPGASARFRIVKAR